MDDRRLRILHTNFHRGWGGQPGRILMLCEGLRDRGHSVGLAVPGDGELARRARVTGGIEVFGGMRFHKPRRVLSFLGDVRRLRRVIRRFLPDVIHSHGSQDTWVVVLANRRPGAARTPHLLTRHNTKRVRDSLANRYLLGTALDGLIVVSGGVLDRYRRLADRNCFDPESVPVIHSSIRFERFEGPRDGGRLRRELGLGDDDQIIGVVGRLVPDKGHQVLIEALARHVPGNPRLHLVLAGTGTSERTLRRQAEDLGVASRVHFLGFRDDVPDVVEALDLLVLPSVDCDASSGALKEAMFCGKAVVATEVGGAGEIVRDGECGLLVPPGDAKALAGAITELLDDPGRRHTMGQGGRRRVTALFSPEILIERTLEVYRRMLVEGRPPRFLDGNAPNPDPAGSQSPPGGRPSSS